MTTDWTADGGKGCTDSHTGTSAAAPLASGVLALAIEANPCLAWRDYKHLVIMTSQPIKRESKHYFRNNAGFSHSHKHGFGLIDAFQMVAATKVILGNHF